MLRCVHPLLAGGRDPAAYLSGKGEAPGTTHRFVTIRLPVDACQPFSWTVDGLSMCFFSPVGKKKGEEHEFSFDLNQLRHVKVRIPCSAGQQFVWTVDGKSMCFVTPAGTKKGDEHQFAFDPQICESSVTIKLPVPGGKRFKWTVDGVEVQFLSPSGKKTGDEHEFTLPRLNPQIGERAPAVAAAKET